ncbi:hypothetical protein Q765_08200 [Flavobacterium rivuli WB 3.3-2 = DSM 21788]|uniref:Secretion system C-terminal sorting domain-containing protein n=1 Tax=Flavobacterium rivuli WB 3.3-2 = DSM 21788 TaxID=1121895 RepID=A0A0A2M2R0_9FLAO|nr:T9SS type A sorting domain-containing protein [Flavobacterium rivuli]KGO86937.1 hypothetical protein Q765_08200 [Flavobacterium rivuli WB 3.3-2 = DSM 21788]
MKKLLLFLLFSTAAFAQLEVQPLPEFALCDPNNDGVTMFDLTVNTPIVLGVLPPNEYAVTYHETEQSAQDNTDAIEEPETYTNIFSPARTQTIYIRVTQIANPVNYAVTTLPLRVLPSAVVGNLPTLNPSNCEGQPTYNLTLNNDLVNPAYTVSYYATEDDALMEQNLITDPASYTTTASTVWLRVVNETSNPNVPTCFRAVPQHLGTNVLTLQTGINDQTAILVATGVAPFLYAMDVNPYQESNIFTNLIPGAHQARVQDACGNQIVLSFEIVAANPPAGERLQTFTAGETLANLEVTGENIQWYTTLTGNIMLPITTLLTDGSTYYAEQYVNDVRSSQRLGVTVSLILGTNTNTLQNLAYYPNPVKNTLSIKNTIDINNIAIYNTLGQQVLNNIVNTTEVFLNFAALNSGIYFVKIQAGNNSKTIRVVKE